MYHQALKQERQKLVYIYVYMYIDVHYQEKRAREHILYIWVRESRCITKRWSRSGRSW